MNNPADTLAALAPCPFCGHHAKLIESAEAPGKYGSPSWKVECDFPFRPCVGGFINLWMQTPEEAIAAWNRRASLKGEAERPMFWISAADLARANAEGDNVIACPATGEAPEDSIFLYTTPPSPQAAGEASFQQRVQPWMLECFGAAIAADVRERCDRFIEESLELVQAVGYDLSRVAALVEYTDSRPAGEPSQEVGGVMVTLAALCLASDLDMHEAGETELARILRPEIIEKIRAKQAAKARDIPFSPLPQATPSPAPQGGGEDTPLQKAYSDACDAIDEMHELSGTLAERITEVIRQRNHYRALSTPPQPEAGGGVTELMVQWARDYLLESGVKVSEFDVRCAIENALRAAALSTPPAQQPGEG